MNSLNNEEPGFSWNKIQDILIISLGRDADVEVLGNVEKSGLELAFNTKLRGCVIDLSNIMVIDSPFIKRIISLIQAFKILGSRGAISGIKPEIAVSLVTLNIDLTMIHISSDVEEAIAHIIEDKPVMGK